MSTSPDHFPRETAGLPESRSSQPFELADGDQFDLRIAPVAKRIGDAIVRMLAYNGSIPGPTLRVRQGSEVMVNVVNDGDLEATVRQNQQRFRKQPAWKLACTTLFSLGVSDWLRQRAPGRHFSIHPSP